MQRFFNVKMELYNEKRIMTGKIVNITLDVSIFCDKTFKIYS